MNCSYERLSLKHVAFFVEFMFPGLKACEKRSEIRLLLLAGYRLTKEVILTFDCSNNRCYGFADFGGVYQRKVSDISRCSFEIR